MIIFDLACPQNHIFEGWFQSQTAFDSQLAQGLIACPQCASSVIRRIPSAPHLAKAASAEPARRAAAAAPAKSAPTGIQAAYQQLMAAIVANCEDVGANFADEARKIHYMEAPSRSIHGQASDQDYEDLRDEGIDVLRLPSLKKH